MVTFAGQNYRRFNRYPVDHCRTRKLVFHWKFWYQTWRNLLQNASFCPRIRHVVLGSSQTRRSRDIWYLCFRWNWFVLLWTVFKSKKQGEEISIAGENWQNGTSHGACPQTIAALGISRLCNLLWRIKICLGCNYWLSSLCNIDHCMSQASKINIDKKQGQ